MGMLKRDAAAFDQFMMRHHLFYPGYSHSQQRVHVSWFKKIIQFKCTYSAQQTGVCGCADCSASRISLNRKHTFLGLGSELGVKNLHHNAGALVEFYPPHTQRAVMRLTNTPTTNNCGNISVGEERVLKTAIFNERRPRS